MYFTIFGRDIPLYGIFFYTGILCAGLVAIAITKKRNIPIFDIVSCGAYTIIGAGIGAKLLFIAVSWKQIIEYNLSFIAILKGGFVFYGGLIGGILGLFIYSKQYKMNSVDFLDIFAVVLPLGHAIGRVGCFFAGCCYGIRYDGPFSYTYKVSAGTTPLGVPLLPVQLIEALLLLILFTVLLSIFLKNPCKRLLSVKIYTFSYSIIRFILEFFRGDKERGALIGISTSQWISIMLVTSIIIISILSTRKKIYKKA